jgi:hypothetical protein
MGDFSLMEMLDNTDPDTALVWHLSYNHYPPIPLVMLGACREAITNANAGEWDAPITLPSEVLWGGANTCPTHALVEHAHLSAFLSDDDTTDRGPE